MFDTWRFHAFFTTTDPTMLDTVTADKVHRGHAIIEQVHADLPWENEWSRLFASTQRRKPQAI